SETKFYIAIILANLIDSVSMDVELGSDLFAEKKEITWDSAQSLLLPNIAGIWLMKHSELITCASSNEQLAVVAVGLSDGRVLLYRYPALNPKAYGHTLQLLAPVKKLLILQQCQQFWLLVLSGSRETLTQWQLV
ncbi:hypothetical protein Ciccas_008632, partial [Cichlidogyrus casuarinus]